MGLSTRSMGMRRVEVVVRFAGDLHEIVEVFAGETVLVGDTPVVAKAGTERTIGLATVTMTLAGEPSHCRVEASTTVPSASSPGHSPPRSHSSRSLSSCFPKSHRRLR